MPVNNNLIAKQPILCIDQNIIGYELLFRTHKHINASMIRDNKAATFKVVTDAMQNFGIKKLLGESKAFINVDRSFLMDDIIDNIPKEHFVLEVLEDVEIDEEILTRIEALHAKGYQIAIDDMDLSDAMCANFASILPYTAIVKVDVNEIECLEKFRDKIDKLIALEVELLAEKVETHDIFEQCKGMGFSYFQGYYFAKPQIIEGKKLDPRKSIILDIIGMLQANEEIDKIVHAFSSNLDLTINLLKYMNASSTGIKIEIASIQQAITLLGRIKLSHWATLFLYSNLVNDDKNMSALMESVELRGELMIQLARRYKNGDSQLELKAYLVGLLSLIDSVFNMPIEEVMSESLFDAEIKSAILDRKGFLGQILKLSIIFEKGNYTNISVILKKINMSVDELSKILSIAFSNVKQKAA
jgi:EAL and modified HD-GYP domain-containing signal transduction protein